MTLSPPRARWPKTTATRLSKYGGMRARVLALFGYVFLIASVIAGVAHTLHISWIWITLAAAGLHFILALVCLLIARRRMKKSMFEATAAELKKDREWLKTLDKKSRST